jgi:hypothetical protein
VKLWATQCDFIRRLPITRVSREYRFFKLHLYFVLSLLPLSSPTPTLSLSSPLSLSLLSLTLISVACARMVHVSEVQCEVVWAAHEESSGPNFNRATRVYKSLRTYLSVQKRRDSVSTYDTALTQSCLPHCRSHIWCSVPIIVTFIKKRKDEKEEEK